MALSFATQMARLDAEMLELRLLYEFQVAKELEEDRHLLLLSRGIRYRIENLDRKREALRRKYKSIISKQTSYDTELVRREMALDMEQKRLQKYNEELAQSQHQMAMVLVIGAGATDAVLSYNVLIKEKYQQIKGQRTRIRNKERALVNWIEKKELVGKSFVIDAKVKQAAEIRVANARPSIDMDVDFDIQIAQSTIPNIAIEETELAKDPRWNVKEAVFDSASALAMLSNQPKPSNITTESENTSDQERMVSESSTESTSTNTNTIEDASRTI